MMEAPGRGDAGGLNFALELAVVRQRGGAVALADFARARWIDASHRRTKAE